MGIEKSNKNKKCPVCEKPMEHKNIGYMRYGYKCTNIHCNYNPNNQ